MASLISCPHCGARPKEEFTIKGDASLARPKADASAEDWYDYVYLRDNPKGLHKEYWHHSSGCRRWLIVERDTVTHKVHGVSDAALAKLGGGA
ncbi:MULTISPECIES: sarcosine oxidase subunit delta [unclassified Rhizobium]|uniref:sarcosine oxidase subunit delta n=1 Tax=Rhizobium TaxID=379 RepID=UPI00084BF36C|nr:MULTISPECIES: sarcosine oxidase subunit delta [unclassified Rhizobium]OEC95079.1 sarcosine oxidase subunit delta [Rhizobium sp. YK2]QYA16052.1 sarcosine oxidase subunit delta [Rhizobium sp. AB2/73]UEQ84595.1 sarcosine oxidase subunit delta [Rhizobium sp. AB2/73]